MTARCSTPETICVQCGDRGFTNAFVYCVKCINVAVHRYCLNVIPSTFDEFVGWVCDDCGAEVQNQSAGQCKTKDHSTYSHAQDSKKVQCRTSLSLLAKIYDAKGYVNVKEKQAICKKSVFFKLIGTMPKKKNNVEFFEQLADLYVIDKQAFLIKDRHLKLCPEEISYLTGLSNKGKAFVEGKSASLPTYFVDLCSRYGKKYSTTAVSVKLISELLKEMVIETADDRVDFERLLNTMFTYVITAKTQGKVPMGCMVFCGSLEAFNDINWPTTISDNTHCFLKEWQEAKRIGKLKKQVRCMVQVVEAWFNMRTSLFCAKDTPCSVDGDKLAPMLRYLGRQLSKSDVERRFEQIKPNEVLNCRDPQCSSQERLLDDGNVEPFSYKCSKHILSAVIDDFIGAYIKKLLTQSMCRLSICDDVDKHFHILKQEFNAKDNFDLFQALCSKGEQLLQGMGADMNLLHNETASQSDMNLATLEEQTMKIITESVGAETALSDEEQEVFGETKAQSDMSSSDAEIASQTDADSQPKAKKQKHLRLEETKKIGSFSK